MFVVLNGEKVLNIVCGDNFSFARKWIMNFLAIEIESLKMAPCEKYVKEKTFFIKETDNAFHLIQSYKQISKGYVYNSSKRMEETIMTIQCVEYDGKNLFHGEGESSMWTSINSEINDRVLKKLDKDALYQVICEMHDRMQLKTTWNHTEYINLMAEVMKGFKKELYTSVARKMKRFGKN
jgi:hypothetical protein